MLPNVQARSLLLVRNGVDHDARVLRAARVAERVLGGRALIAGVATGASPASACTVEGIAVVRFPPRPPAIARLLGRAARPRHRRPATAAAGGRGAPASAGSARDGLTFSVRARRILSGTSYAVQAIALARRVRPTVVQANDWNTMWAGLFIKGLCGARLVYDSHELWADRNGRWEWRPWLLACEALFVRAADEVLTSSPGYAEVLARRYRIARPAVVRNIPERHGARPTPNRDRPAAPVVVYIGGLMPGRGLEQMIDALALLVDARLRAVGPGAAGYRTELLARAAAAGVADRVELCPAVAPAAVQDALAGASAGLCLIQPVCRSYELCLPNKLFEYAAAGVPVLASDLPVLGELVRREGFGELAPPADSGAIAAGFERLLEPASWTTAARRAGEFAAAHSWAGEARTLAEVYRSAGSRASAERSSGRCERPRAAALEPPAASELGDR